MPKVTELFDAIGERIRVTAGTQTLFGEPLLVEGRTIIPVAKLRYGFGAGGGEIEHEGKDGSEVEQGGGGGGAGVAATPMGFLVVTAKGERFVPVRRPFWQVTLVWLVDLAVGYAVSRRSRSA